MREFILVGTPSEVVDEIEDLVAQTDVDGFNYTPFVCPGSYVDLIDQVVPELQKRGLMRNSYERATFREQIFGRGNARLPSTHPGARFRPSSTRAAAGDTTDTAGSPA
jgi:hypothetical protein